MLIENTALLPRFCTVYDCCHAAAAERVIVTCKFQIIYCLALYRIFLLPWFKQLFKFIYVLDCLLYTLMVLMCHVENSHVGWQVIP